MKTKLVFLSILIFNVASISAQSDYSNYLNRAMEKLEAGDCESASKFYNVYKDLTGDTKKSVETLIADCSKKIVGQKSSYRINDKLEINGKLYRVAHIEDKGKHGFAIYDMGAGPITEEMLSSRQVPTMSEMLIIRRNMKKLKLSGGNYWIIDRCDGGRGAYLSVYWDSWAGKYTKEFCCSDMKDSNSILLIHRF